MKLFMDNVPSLAIQAPIVREIPSMLCPADVYSMASEIVAKVAGESEEKTAHRAQLLHERQTLENGSRICKQYAMRPTFRKLPSKILHIDNKLTRQAGRAAPVESEQLKDSNTMPNEAGKVGSFCLPSTMYLRSIADSQARPIISPNKRSRHRLPILYHSSRH